MNASELPPNILNKMSAKDRKGLGLMTGEEAVEKYVARSEKELQKSINKFLSLRGIWFYNARMDRKTTSAKGTPDYLLCVNGTAVALEAKVGRNKPSTEQEQTRWRMEHNGWRWFIVRSLEEVKLIVDQQEAFIKSIP